jgi:hypothetical protein
MAATTHRLILASAPVRPRGVLAHIRELLQESSSGKQAKLELLYRASRDGWRGQDFHSRCDNKGATVRLLHSPPSHTYEGVFVRDRKLPELLAVDVEPIERVFLAVVHGRLAQKIVVLQHLLRLEEHRLCTTAAAQRQASM